MSRNNEWRKRNRAKVAAYMREWRKRNRERYNAYARAYHAAHAEKHREAFRKWQRSPRGKEVIARWNEANREKVQASQKKGEAMRKLRKMTDAGYYAKRRASARLYKAFGRVRQGLRYKPVFSRRIPDWAVMGGKIMDVRSQWLRENLTPAAKAWGREKVRTDFEARTDR